MLQAPEPISDKSLGGEIDFLRNKMHGMLRTPGLCGDVHG